MSKFLDKNGLAHFWNNIKSYIDNSGSSGGGGGTPPGGIIIWSGTADNVPDGWHICDGTNGTPDLRGRFVLGNSASHAIGSTDGSETVTLVGSQVPEYRFLRSTKKFAEVTADTGSAFALTDFSETLNEINVQPHENMPPYYVLAYIMKL